MLREVVWVAFIVAPTWVGWGAAAPAVVGLKSCLQIVVRRFCEPELRGLVGIGVVDVVAGADLVSLSVCLRRWIFIFTFTLCFASSRRQMGFLQLVIQAWCEVVEAGSRFLDSWVLAAFLLLLVLVLVLGVGGPVPSESLEVLVPRKVRFAFRLGELGRTCGSRITDHGSRITDHSRLCCALQV